MLGEYQGLMGGFQYNISYKNINIYGINQYLHANDMPKNAYTWSETTYKIRPLIQPGLSAFLRYFMHHQSLNQDYGLEYVAEIKYLRISLYVMNPWNERIYSFIGISLKI
ncbi:MAG: hypothetical protein NW207_05725 [Cytophagales bacterium]|nr:hypothetical protein [Cytophagales bacterium]